MVGVMYTHAWLVSHIDTCQQPAKGCISCVCEFQPCREILMPDRARLTLKAF